MSAIEQRARELLASVTREMYPDDIAKKYVIDKLMVDELDLISTRASVRAIIAALTPPEGYVLVPAEPTAGMIAAAEEAHMPFGDMGFAISAALAARPQVKP